MRVNGHAGSGDRAVNRDCDRWGHYPGVIITASCARKGVVIYLCAPVSRWWGGWRRFGRGRALALTAKPLSEEVSEVLAERDALYREAAHHVIGCVGVTRKVGDSDYYRPAFGLRQLTAVHTHSSDITATLC